VLLGLVGALVFLPFLIASDQQRLSRHEEGVITQSAPLPALDLTRETNVSERLQSPYKLDFSTTNKLFNPFHGKEPGWNASSKLPPAMKSGLAVVTKITPLVFDPHAGFDRDQ
jgi:hypothetical protein